MSHKALALKEEGNVYFQNGNYEEAETCYTQAIQKDPSTPAFFTNRAMTRLKLTNYDSVINDCLNAITLTTTTPTAPTAMKAYYYLSQAQLALKHPNEAYASALTAYDKCLQTRDKSIQNVSNLVLQCKKAKWEVRERERIRSRSALLRELEEGLETRREAELEHLDERLEVGEMGAVEAREEREEISRNFEAKIEELRTVFAIADPAHLARREVPDWMIDSVTFSIMHDPVVTKTGVSYDRSTLVEHLKRSERDPLTGEPLRWEDVRTNRALKEACEEFLRENGWAVDW